MSKREREEQKLKKVVEASSEERETESDVPDLELLRKKQKRVVTRDDREDREVERTRKGAEDKAAKQTKKGKGDKSLKKEESEMGSPKKQRQSITVEGSPTRSTAKTIKDLCLPSKIKWQVPKPEDRPWTPPPGYMCVYESYFKYAHLFFPIPRPIIEFCARKKIAMSQLTTVTIIELIGLIMFGAEVGVRVDAAFLERTEKVIASRSPGTLYTNGGFVVNKIDRINNWQTHFFFIKIDEASVGDAESDVIAEWNRVLGVAGKDKDQLIADKSESFKRDREKIKRKGDRGYELYTKDRILRVLAGKDTGGLQSERVGETGTKFVVPWSAQVAASRGLLSKKDAIGSSSEQVATSTEAHVSMPKEVVTKGIVDPLASEQAVVTTSIVGTQKLPLAAESRQVATSMAPLDAPIVKPVLEKDKGLAGKTKARRERRATVSVLADLPWGKGEAEMEGGGKSLAVVGRTQEDMTPEYPAIEFPTINVSDAEFSRMFDDVPSDTTPSNETQGMVESAGGDGANMDRTREMVLTITGQAAGKERDQGERGEASEAVKRSREENLGIDAAVREEETIESNVQGVPPLPKKPRTKTGTSRGSILKKGGTMEGDKSKFAGGQGVRKGVARAGMERSHDLMLEYRGERSIADDPESCGRLLQQIPEIDDAFLGEEIDPDENYNEFATLVIRLINSRNRTSRGHEGAMVELAKKATELEEEIRRLREENRMVKEENVVLKTLETDLNDEKERRIAKENEVASLEVDVEAAKMEVEREKTRLRIRDEKMEEMRARLRRGGEEMEELKKELASVRTQEEKVEEMRAELSKKEEEIEKLRGELVAVDGMKGKISSLDNELRGCKQEIVAMDQGCRATLKRLFKEQADALRKGYAAKNDRLREDFAKYLKDREKFDEVDTKLAQAEEAVKILKRVKTDFHVAVPDSIFADLEKTKAGLTKELESIYCEKLAPEDLTLGLPDEIGACDVERIDFRTAIMIGGGSGAIDEEKEEEEAMRKELETAMESEAERSEVDKGQRTMDVVSIPLAETEKARIEDGQGTEVMVSDSGVGVKQTGVECGQGKETASGGATIGTEKGRIGGDQGAKVVEAADVSDVRGGEAERSATEASTSEASIDVVN